jgi:hypothetical protein
VQLAEKHSIHAQSVGRGRRRMGNGLVNVVGKGSSPPARVGGLPGRGEWEPRAIACAAGTVDG